MVGAVAMAMAVVVAEAMAVVVAMVVAEAMAVDAGVAVAVVVHFHEEPCGIENTKSFTPED